MPTEFDDIAWKAFKTFCFRWLRCASILTGIGLLAGIAAYFIFPKNISTGNNLIDEVQGYSGAVAMFAWYRFTDVLNVLSLNEVIDLTFKESGFDALALVVDASSHAAAGFLLGIVLYPIIRIVILPLQLVAKNFKRLPMKL